MSWGWDARPSKCVYCFSHAPQDSVSEGAYLSSVIFYAGPPIITRWPIYCWWWHCQSHDIIKGGISIAYYCLARKFQLLGVTKSWNFAPYKIDKYIYRTEKALLEYFNDPKVHSKTNDDNSSDNKDMQNRILNVVNVMIKSQIKIGLEKSLDKLN